MHHEHQEGDTWSAITSNVPCPICPPFNASKAPFAMLKVAALSTAVMTIHAPVATLVSLQHPPQLGEFHAMPGAPPI